MIKFPDGFFFGAATSAYQVEGNNLNSDWWQWERASGLKETCGDACRHYELYREDFALARSLNHNAHRFSVEWSRIEPREGEFNEEEIGHYRRVIASLKENSLEPIVTLHHFTNPLWFARMGGWKKKGNVRFFLRYVEKIASALGASVRYWVTINEPMVYVYYG
ncbi:MAG: glycoside hydrolase family 1 protein, partial [Candidatus Omnitrophica bacterium]|nr:glycoside hydrolase family 1 protein [Candidatus Omnitrophota bacterium]